MPEVGAVCREEPLLAIERLDELSTHVGLAAVVRQLARVHREPAAPREPLDRSRHDPWMGIPREEQTVAFELRQHRDAAAVGLGAVLGKGLGRERLHIGGAEQLEAARRLQLPWTRLVGVEPRLARLLFPFGLELGQLAGRRREQGQNEAAFDVQARQVTIRLYDNGGRLEFSVPWPLYQKIGEPLALDGPEGLGFLVWQMPVAVEPDVLCLEARLAILQQIQDSRYVVGVDMSDHQQLETPLLL